MTILSRFAADLLVVLHLAFIVFVLFGGLLVLWRRQTLFLHIPAVLWGILIEFLDWQCPLTPLEQYFRQLHGLPYQGTFIEQYVIPLIYPPGLTRQMQIIFGTTVIAVNVAIYAFLVMSGKGAKR